MALVVPNISDQLMLQYVLQTNNLLLKLFSNNLTPSKTTDLASITEVTSSGYFSIVLSTGDWEIDFVDGINKAVYPTQIFNITETANIYGYYVTTTANQLMWIERFEVSPYPLPIDGGEIFITPTLNFN